MNTFISEKYHNFNVKLEHLNLNPVIVENAFYSSYFSPDILQFISVIRSFYFSFLYSLFYHIIFKS